VTVHASAASVPSGCIFTNALPHLQAVLALVRMFRLVRRFLHGSSRRRSGRIFRKFSLVQISFFRLCPSTSTHAKVGHGPQLCHPDWSGLGFPTSQYRTRSRMWLSVRKAARSSSTPLSWTGNPGERRGGTCSFTWTARKCQQAIHNPTRFSLRPTRLDTINGSPAHQAPSIPANENKIRVEPHGPTCSSLYSVSPVADLLSF
jgi:hypothetical protein